jgi:hypothetical protein
MAAQGKNSLARMLVIRRQELILSELFLRLVGVAEVPLSNFSVEYHYDGFIEVLVHAFDGKKMALAFIDRAAIDDAWPDRRLSNSDRKRLVDRNLTVISELIAGKHERGEITTYQGTGGQVFPRIDIATGELAAVRNRLSDTMVLDVAAVSGFTGAF